MLILCKVGFTKWQTAVPMQTVEQSFPDRRQATYYLCCRYHPHRGWGRRCFISEQRLWFGNHPLVNVTSWAAPVLCPNMQHPPCEDDSGGRAGDQRERTPSCYVPLTQTFCYHVRVIPWSCESEMITSDCDTLAAWWSRYYPCSIGLCFCILPSLSFPSWCLDMNNLSLPGFWYFMWSFTLSLWISTPSFMEILLCES